MTATKLNDRGAASTAGDERGRHAKSPSEIPGPGWKDVLARTRAEVKHDKATLLAAGVAYYSLLALVPAMVALVSIYGLISDPSSVDRQVGDWLGAAPREVRDLLSSQLKSITNSAGTAAGIGAAIGIIVALWSASSGMAHLMEAINVAYDEDETRSVVRRRGLALAFTVGAIAFVLVAIGVITVLPAMLAHTGIGAPGRVIAGIARWIVLLFGMMVALAVLYRYAPDRDEPRWAWTSPGAIAATLLWLVASAALAIYTGNFGKYNETYGSLGAVVVLMLWLFITALAVVLGAELNAEVERQTVEDSTAGRPQQLGQRDATAADTVGATSAEIGAGAGTDSSTDGDSVSDGPDGRLRTPEDSSAAGQASTEAFARRLGHVAATRGSSIAVAESLTGGLLVQALAKVEGSGEWLAGGIVAYASSVKHRMLDVTAEHVVSALCAEQMATGARRQLGADVAVAVTGVAGPEAQDGEPPGTVWIAVDDGRQSVATLHEFTGEPAEICEHTVVSAINLTWSALSGAKTSMRDGR